VSQFYQDIEKVLEDTYMYMAFEGVFGTTCMVFGVLGVAVDASDANEGVCRGVFCAWVATLLTASGTAPNKNCEHFECPNNP
jgi:hypothetical protein